MKYTKLFLMMTIFFWSSIDLFKDSQMAVANAAEGRVVWHSFDEGLAKAKKESKNVIIDFYTSWCHWCKVMDQKTFSNPEIQKQLGDKFVTIRINAESAVDKATFKGQIYTNVQLTQAFGVRGFPSLAFLDKQGEPITVIPGYIPPETFTHILDYIDQELYKQKMSFDDFIKKKQAEQKRK